MSSNLGATRTQIWHRFVSRLSLSGSASRRCTADLVARRGFFVGSCSSGQDTTAAEGQLMATQEFGWIYAEAGDELGKPATEQDTV